MAKGVKGSTPSVDAKPIKTSLVVLPLTMKKVRYIGLMEGSEISSLVEEGFQEVIKRYEKKHGPIPIK
jgi:hypothetical protein